MLNGSMPLYENITFDELIPRPPCIDSRKSTPRSGRISNRQTSARFRQKQTTVSPNELFEQLNPPLTAAVALKNFMKYLKGYEQAEILEYKHIYFLGLDASKVETNMIHGHNSGYDDEKGDYKLVNGDHIGYRYEVKEMLGQGSFGKVVKAFDHKEKCFVALKVIRNKKRFHKQGKVEIKILEHLRDEDEDHENSVIHIKDSLVFRQHICITFELLSINLYEFLRGNSYSGLSLPLIRRFATQLLKGLKLMKDLNIIHCDLKPENILLKSSNKSGIKIIDLGSG